MECLVKSCYSKHIFRVGQVGLKNLWRNWVETKLNFAAFNFIAIKIAMKF